MRMFQNNIYLNLYIVNAILCNKIINQTQISIIILILSTKSNIKIPISKQLPHIKYHNLQIIIINIIILLLNQLLILFYFKILIFAYIQILRVMNIKDQAFEKCKKLWSITEQNTKNIYHNIVDNGYVQQSTSKIKNFYQSNKTLCIGIGVTIVALFFITKKIKNNTNKQSKQQPNKDKIIKAQEENVQKQQKKKSQIIPPATNKKFVIDDDVQFFPDQPSTDIVNKEGNGRRKGKKQVDSSQQTQKQDRIFFQMYHTYRKTQPDQ